MNATNPNHPAALADWSDALIRGSRQSLDRMDHTLSLAEAKIRLLREMREQRREREKQDS